MQTVSQKPTHSQQWLVKENPMLYDSRRASVQVSKAYPAVWALLCTSPPPCQTLSLHLSLDSLSPLLNPHVSGILHGNSKKGGRESKLVHLIFPNGLHYELEVDLKLEM